jgi:hypothetical protein
MSEYTPTTAQVRTDYVRAHDAWGQDFDLWLASVKADAWEEGEADGRHNERCFIDIDEIVNPYRGKG